MGELRATLRSISTEQFMRSTPFIMAVLSTLAVSGSAAVNAQPIGVSATTMPWGAPIGHLQPRAQQFAPGSSAEQSVQNKISSFDAEQQRADEELDQRLNICRGC
jgi:hypothetical protein